MARTRLMVTLLATAAVAACAARPVAPPGGTPAARPPTVRREAPAVRPSKPVAAAPGTRTAQQPPPRSSPRRPPPAAAKPAAGQPVPAAPASPPVRRIGLLFPSGGPRRDFGADARRGADLCMEDPERQRSFRFESVARDESEGDDPAAVVAGLVERERVIALIGPLLSDTARAALPAAERRSLPVISPTAASGGLGVGNRVFFRTCMTMESFTAALAGRASERLGSPAFALLSPAESYGRTLAAAFGPALEARGGRVLLAREYAPGLRDLIAWSGTLAEGLRRPGAAGGWGVDALFLAGSAEDAGLILPRLAYRGLDPRRILVVGTSAFNTPAFPRLAGGYAEGVLFADGFFAGSAQPGARSFVRRFRDRHGVDPGAAAAQACAAVEVLAAALQGGAATPAETLAALSALGEVATVLGPVRLHAGGGVERRPFFITVRDGKLAEEGQR